MSDTDETINFAKTPTLQVKEKPSRGKKDPAGIISKLNKTALNSYRWKSEGVGEDLLFVEGWDNAGQHKIVESKEHSQQDKNLWGGKSIGDGVSWYGPRTMSGEIHALNELKAKKQSVSIEENWEKIRKSGKYIEKEDWKKISQFWRNRSPSLEEEVLELYKPMRWWREEMGKRASGSLVDFEIDLEGIGKILEKSESELKNNEWNYGQLLDNKKLKIARMAGNLEGTAFNYLKLLIWPEVKGELKLKEKNIAKVVMGLLSGEKYGFDCENGEEALKTKFFKECGAGSASQAGWKVKRVMKASVKEIAKSVPSREKRGGWKQQTQAESSEWSKMSTMDFIESSALIEEKCETSSWGWVLLSWDLSQKIRQETCDLIIRPWFGDTVSDKRLCLIEVPDHQYYLRMSRYFKMIDWITWHNKNTFWTKCSNYGI